jgi:predicted nucleic acid-binding protein
MPEAISNTSPLLYLHRVEVMHWLPKLFSEVWVPQQVFHELQQGREKGHDVPDPAAHGWLRQVDPLNMPSEWLALDLGAGELAAMSLALEHPSKILLLDDRLARQTAKAAGLNVWGTLRILLEAKRHGLTERVEPLITRLSQTGMWFSTELRQRILALAGENDG